MVTTADDDPRSGAHREPSAGKPGWPKRVADKEIPKAETVREEAMPWFPEFGYAMKMAAEGRAAEVSADAVRSYIESVHSGVPELGRSPEEQIVLHDPRAGRVEGSVAFKEFVESSLKWLAEANARTEWVASTATPGRAVGELIAYLTIDGKEVLLPIAVVAEQKQDQAEFRVYYSQWPLTRGHTVRPPILKDAGIDPEGWPGKYHEALTAGDADAIVDAFEPGGYFREPAGPQFIHRGQELHPFFSMFFSAGGGIKLEHCAITDDGAKCALEYNCVQWGATEIPPQAGIGVYERGPSGKLIAARVYDDVEAPELKA